VKLELLDASGKTVSQNLYWLGAEPSSFRELTRLAATQLKVSANGSAADGNVKIKVELTNPGSVVSLENKLTLVSSRDKVRILPAYYSDNYISLLPGETRSIEVEYPASAIKGGAEINLRGWNAVPQTITVK